MTPLNTIVVGIDISTSSAALLRQAARMATAGGGEGNIVAVHVADRSPLAQLLSLGSKINEAEVLRAASENLEGTVASAGVEAETIVRIGSPSSILVKIAEERKADLLLVNAHNEQGRRLGSVAAHCVRESKVPTLLIRDWHEGPFISVFACIDFSNLAPAVFQQALDAALRDKASLELVHAIFPPREDYYGHTQHHRMDDTQSYEERVASHVDKRIELFLQPFQKDLEEVASFSTTILETRHPGSAITDHLAKSSTGLAVLGTTGRTQITGLHFGSNAERLVRNAPCSVLAVKPR